MDGHVLIVDGDAATCDLLRTALDHDGFRVDVASDLATALAFDRDYDVVLADFELAAVAPLKARSPTTEVVVLTHWTALDAARGAIRDGAFDFVMRPFYIEEVSLTVACAAARSRGRGLESPLGHILKNHELAR